MSSSSSTKNGAKSASSVSKSPPNEVETAELNRKQQKAKLRSRIRKAIKSLPQRSIEEQSNKVFETLFSMPEYKSKDCKSVGLFLSMPKNEILTIEACRKILHEDKKVLYVPRCGLDFECPDMEMTRVNPTASTFVNDTEVNECQGIASSSTNNKEAMFYDDWPRNKWGIPEAPIDDKLHPIAKPGDVDILVVPGLAFDKYGGRLGQGKGYYDRFIAKMRGCEETSMDVKEDDIITSADNDGRETITKKRKVEGTCANEEEEKMFMGYPKPLLIAVGLEPSFLDHENKDAKGDETMKRIPMSSHDFPMDKVIVPQLDTAWTVISKTNK